MRAEVYRRDDPLRTRRDSQRQCGVSSVQLRTARIQAPVLLQASRWNSPRCPSEVDGDGAHAPGRCQFRFRVCGSAAFGVPGSESYRYRLHKSSVRGTEMPCGIHLWSCQRSHTPLRRAPRRQHLSAVLQPSSSRSRACPARPRLAPCGGRRGRSCRFRQRWHSHHLRRTSRRPCQQVHGTAAKRSEGPSRQLDQHLRENLPSICQARCAEWSQAGPPAADSCILLKQKRVGLAERL